MSYQACGVLGLGNPPPPLRMEPRLNAAAFVASMAFFSIWVIWPIFSSSVIWLSRAATRSSTGLEASIHGRPEVDDPDAAGPVAPGVPVAGGVPHAATRATTATAPRRLSQRRGRLVRNGYEAGILTPLPMCGARPGSHPLRSDEA